MASATVEDLACEVISEAGVAVVKRAFFAADRRQQGWIPAAHVGPFLRGLTGIPAICPTDAQLADFEAKLRGRGGNAADDATLGAGGNGRATLTSILSLITRVGRASSRYNSAELKLFFRPYDFDEEGFVAEPVFFNLMCNVGDFFNREDCQDIVDELRDCGEGHLAGRAHAKAGTKENGDTPVYKPGFVNYELFVDMMADELDLDAESAAMELV